MRLLERNVELATLARMAACARRGEAGVVLVQGPAGTGRTALLDTASRATHGMRVLRASGAPAETTFALARALLGPSLAAADARQRRELLDGAASPALAALEPAARPTGDAAATEPPLAIRHGLYWYTANLSAQAPLLLTVDDAHLADPASLRWLAHTARRLSGLRVLLVLATRSGDPSSDPRALADIAAQDLCEVIRPRPLSEAAVRVLLIASGVRVHSARPDPAGERPRPPASPGPAGAPDAGAEPLQSAATGPPPDPDAALAHAVHAGTRGNPALVHSVLRALAGPHAELGAALARVADAAAEAASETGLGALRRQPVRVQTVTQALAVLGDAATRTRVSALTGLDETLAAQALGRLGEIGLLSADGTLTPARARERVLDSLPAQRRASAHADAALLLHRDGAPAEQIAPHLLAAGGLTEPWVSETLRVAAEVSLGRGDARQATAYLRQALAAPAPKPDLPGLLARLGAAEVTVAANAAVRHLGHALELTSSVPARAAITDTLCDALVRDGRSREAAALLEGMIAEIGPIDRELGLLLEARRLATALEDTPEILTTFAAAERDQRLTGATPGERAVLCLRAALSATLGGSAARTLALAERGLAEQPPEEANDRSPGPAPGQMPVAGHAAGAAALLAVDRPDEAERFLSAAMAAADPRGQPVDYALLAAWRARARLRQAKIEAAAADAAHALDLLRSEPWPRTRLLPAASLIEVLTEQGEYARAARTAGLDLAPGADRVWQAAHLLSARGRLRAASGEERGGLEDLLACGRHMLAWGRDNPAVCGWRSDVALVDAALGEREHALRMAEEELVLARAWGTPRVLAQALRASGVAAGGAAGLARLEEAAALLADTPDVLLLAHVRADLGEARHARGDKRGARLALRRSLEVAQRAGARPLARRAQRLLVATGARPRRPAHVGVDALTDSERRVALLACQGRTNREIADALYVRQRTIEIHLTSAYRKLGISSRSELPTALGG